MIKIFNKENGTIHIHTVGTLFDANYLVKDIEKQAKVIETRCNNMTKTILFVCEPKANYKEKDLKKNIEIYFEIKLTLEEILKE